MNRFKIILFIIIAILIDSCESVNDVEQNIPYDKLYVVNGQISGGDVNPEIIFTKTLPLNTEFSIEEAELKDVTAYIKTEDLKIYPLEYKKDGIYKSKYDLEIISGQKYELYAYADETRIYASTIAPQIPEIIEARLVEGHIECKVMPNKDEVYSCVYVLIENYQIGYPRITFRENDFFSVEGPFESGDAAVMIRSGVVPEEYRNQTEQYKLAVEVYAWDKSYKKYFKTKENNKPIDDVFSQGGGAIDWNVSGDNAIGMFIGFATTLYTNITN